MELFVVGSILLCVLVGTGVGLKLLSIALGSRKLPEFAIGMALLTHAAVSQPALLAQQALGEEASLGLQMGIGGLRVFAFFITLVGFSLFTWRVFGVESRWRRALAAGLSVAALISASASLWGSWLQLSSNVPMPLYQRIGLTPHFFFAFGWVSLESLRYYGLMRKRRALGLADPVVTNRFLVWGAGEGVASLVILALCVVMMNRSALLTTDSTVAGLVTAAGLVNALVWWLTFAPPTAYLRWVRANAGAGAPHG
jgi:hypothetical protein